MRGLFPSGAATFAAVLLISHLACAQVIESVATPASGAETKAKVFENYKYEDTSGITDLRLKAERGSLSRYSAKLSLGYQGPVLDDLSNPYQPDPDESLTHNPTSVRGNVSLRYRWNSESSLGFGTGVSRVTPFTDDARTDISTPFINFDHVDRIRAYQIRESIEGSMTTTPEMRNAGQFGSVAVNVSVLRNINYSRWEIGVDTNLNYGLYKRPYDPGPADAVVRQASMRHSRVGISARQNFGDGNASQFSLGLSPTVRFRISDKVGSYTSLHFGFNEPRSAFGAWALRERTVSQRAGIDIAVTHAIYISPYLAFYPQDLSVSTTTVNVSTIISML